MLDLLLCRRFLASKSSLRGFQLLLATGVLATVWEIAVGTLVIVLAMSEGRDRGSHRGLQTRMAAGLRLEVAGRELRLGRTHMHTMVLWQNVKNTLG